MKRLREKITVLMVGLLMIFAPMEAQVWDQIGVINGFSFSVSLSDDGSVVVIGAPYNAGNGYNAGHVRVFENQNSVWSQIGNTIEGGDQHEHIGSSTSISADGSVVAIGGSGAGYTSIYENPTVSSEPLQQQGISLYPNPTGGILYFEVENTSTAFNMVQKLTVCDITGKQLLVKTQVQPPETIDISGLESGIYIICVQTGDKVFTRKIIKE